MNQRGFSLIEIIVAIAIGSGIMAGVFTLVRSTQIKANRGRAVQDVRTIGAAVDQFQMDNGRYPASLDELVHDPGDLPNYDASGYLPGNKVPKDPWGSEYTFSPENAPEGFDYEIISYGSDKQEGGTGAGADIKYSELQ